MRSSAAVACIAVGVSLVAGCQTRPAQFTPQDESRVRGMFDATVGYLRAGDWATWAGQYAPSGLLQPPNAQTVSGRAAIQAWGQAFPPVEQFSFSSVEVLGDGDLAYGTSAYALKLKGVPPDTGKQLVVFRRAADGKWEVVAAAFSSDLPAPGQPARSTSAKK